MTSTVDIGGEIRMATVILFGAAAAVVVLWVSGFHLVAAILSFFGALACSERLVRLWRHCTSLRAKALILCSVIPLWVAVMFLISRAQPAVQANVPASGHLLVRLAASGKNAA